MKLLLGRRGDHLRCRQVQKLLQSYLDGELPAPSAEKVAEHLEACARCGYDAAALEQVKRAVASLDRGVDAQALARLRRFAQRLPDDGP